MSLSDDDDFSPVKSNTNTSSYNNNNSANTSSHNTSKRSIFGNLSDSDDEPVVQNKRPKFHDLPTPPPTQSSQQSQSQKSYTSNSTTSDIRSNYASNNSSPSFSSSTMHKSFSNLSNAVSKRFNESPSLSGASQSSSSSSSASFNSKNNGAANPNSDFASKMMKKMGHVEGKGLGKFSQGIVKPIDESDQKGKQGLGFNNNNKQKNFDKKIESWNYENDPVSAVETPVWLENEDKGIPELETLKGWKKIGKKKRILDDESQFCSKEVLKQVLECKSIFDNLEDKDMRQARSRSNPFESISACFFQNRAAMKMANLDAVFNFMFTDPQYPDGRSKIEWDEPLYFCDVCAGPGGFSEYVLWRKKWKAKGFGMTLKQENDFALDDFLAGPAECFETYYGENGVDGDGDVTKARNLKEFKKFVLDQTNGRGVHFMMADGGFSVEGNENIQEILSKQLYLCQFLCALCVLRTGGNFVCKLFDLFTPFSVGLIYLLYLCFDRISIHKPVTSRPANSERYIICEGARESKYLVEEYLFDVNNELNKNFRDERSHLDVVECVPILLLKNDKEFFNYIKTSNENIGNIQVINLKKIQTFTQNRNLYDTRQADLFEECLKIWKIPRNLNRSQFTGELQPQQQQQQKQDKFKSRFQKTKVKYNPVLVNHKQLISKLNGILNNSKTKFDINSTASLKIKEVNRNMWNEKFTKSSIYDYKCTIGCGSLVLLLSCGRSTIYEYELNSPANCLNYIECNSSVTGQNSSNTDEWKKLDTNLFNIELPRETLLLAEKCVEYKGNDKGQQKLNAIHIIDALFIDGENMLVENDRVIPSEERTAKLEIFIKSITKKSRGDFNIRIRELVDLKNLDSTIFDCLQLKKPKGRTVPFKYAVNIPFSNPSEQYVYPSGIYFFKYIQSPWSKVISKKTGQFYHYKSDTRESTYGLPNDDYFYSHPKSYLEHGFVWKLPSEEFQIEKNNNQAQQQDDQLIQSKQELLDLINK